MKALFRKICNFFTTVIFGKKNIIQTPGNSSGNDWQELPFEDDRFSAGKMIVTAFTKSKSSNIAEEIIEEQPKPKTKVFNNKKEEISEPKSQKNNECPHCSKLSYSNWVLNSNYWSCHECALYGKNRFLKLNKKGSIIGGVM
jgi:hypothetical protein